MVLSDTWNVRHVAPFPVYVLLEIEPRVLRMVGKHDTNTSTFTITNHNICKKEISKNPINSSYKKKNKEIPLRANLINEVKNFYNKDYKTEKRRRRHRKIEEPLTVSFLQYFLFSLLETLMLCILAW